MARRKITFTQDEYYHIYNRGVSRQPIFCCDDNYRFLLHRVKKYAAQWQVVVIAYCLMPNHYHFVLLQAGEHSISHFMQSLFNSYTKAFNKMCNRSGTLFEGPFRAAHVTEAAYLLHLCRYVHRNPLDAGLVTNLLNWPYSNYTDNGHRVTFYGTRINTDFTDFSRFLWIFGKQNSLICEICVLF